MPEITTTPRRCLICGDVANRPPKRTIAGPADLCAKCGAHPRWTEDPGNAPGPLGSMVTIHRDAKTGERQPLQVRYCSPGDCVNPDCANYAPEWFCAEHGCMTVRHICPEVPDVPPLYRAAFTKEYRAGFRLERETMPAYPGPDRSAWQAGWVAGKRAKFALEGTVRRTGTPAEIAAEAALPELTCTNDPAHCVSGEDGRCSFHALVDVVIRGGGRDAS